MSSKDAKWNEETKSGTYSDKIHHGEMKRGWDNNPVLSGKPKAMTVADLLKPRYKTYADFPGNRDYPLGKIIIIEADNRPMNENGHRVARCPFEEYPHIFKKLEWWEDREEKDMPHYLKHTLDGETTYHKVDSWNMKDMTAVGENDRCNLKLWATGYNYLPATEEEYNQYLTSVQLK